MYCVSIKNKDFDKVIKIVEAYDMAEIRLDLCDFNYREIEMLFSNHDNLIATYRGSGKSLGRYRKNIFKTAILSGAKWVDLDMEYNDSLFIRGINEYIQDSNFTKLILSFHNYNETPPMHLIEEYIESAQAMGADIVKLAFYSNSLEDNDKILSLYKKHENLVAFNMGEIGKVTRIRALELGAPFTYVSLPEVSTAPGQMTIDEIKKYPHS